jgi:hypothetical protein
LTNQCAYTALPFAIIALLIVFLLDGSKIKSQMTWLFERSVAVIHHDHHHDVERGEGVENKWAIADVIHR